MNNKLICIIIKIKTQIINLLLIISLLRVKITLFSHLMKKINLENKGVKRFNKSMCLIRMQIYYIIKTMQLPCMTLKTHK